MNKYSKKNKNTFDILENLYALLDKYINEIRRPNVNNTNSVMT